jgi:hypothetical protein
MSEKIYEFHLDHNLTAAKRRLLFEYIEANAHRSPWKIAYEWEEATKTLHVQSNVVKWELIFQGKLFQVYGNGPFWARMLFTDKLRTKLRLGISLILTEIGLLDGPQPSKPAKSTKITKSHRKK